MAHWSGQKFTLVSYRFHILMILSGMICQKSEGLRFSEALPTTLLPILCSVALFYTDKNFNGDLRKVSVIIFAPCAYIGSLATQLQPGLLKRFVVSCFLCVTPYFLYSWAVHLCWKFDLVEFGQFSGLSVLLVLFVICLTFPLIFIYSLTVGTGFSSYLRDQILRIPIRILPPEGDD